MRRLHGDDELFQRPHWSRDVHQTPIGLRLMWAFRNDRDFEFTDREIGVLRRAAAGEDVGIQYLNANKAANFLKLPKNPYPPITGETT